jgi:ABC-type phosphate/phosphonate transport system substrate-binding protein
MNNIIRYALFVFLLVFISSCSGQVQETADKIPESLGEIIPYKIASTDLFNMLLIDSEISLQALEETNKPPGPISDGYLRAWKMDGDEAIIWAMVLKFIYDSDVKEAYTDFYTGLKNDKEELQIGDEGVMVFSDFNLTVVGIRNGYYFILTGSAILEKNASSPDRELVLELANMCNENIGRSQAGLIERELKLNNESFDTAKISPDKTGAIAKTASQHGLLALLMPQKAEIFTIPLNLEGKNNGQMSVGIITKNLGKAASGKCTYEIEAYLRDVIVKDNGDPELTRGNGDVITYFKFTTICGVLEYRTTDIAPENGIEDNEKMDFTVNNTSEGRLITSFTCEADCKSQFPYSVYGYARDIDDNDALDVAAAILTLGIRITNRPGKEAIIKDLSALNALRKATGLYEISSIPGSNILPETRKIYGDALGEGNSGEKTVSIPPAPSAEAEPEQTQETAATDCSLYGVIPGDPGVIQADLDQLAMAMTDRSDCQVTLQAVPDSQDIVEMISDNSVDFAWVSFFDYVQLHQTQSLIPVGIPYSERLGAGIYAMFVTRSDSGFTGLADLEGSDLAYSIQGDFIGVTLPRIMLTSEGFDPDAFFNYTAPIGFDPLLMFSALLDGSFDAVVTWSSELFDPRDYVVESLPDIYDATTVLAYSPWIPQALIVSLDDSVSSENLKESLFDLGESDVLYNIYQTLDVIDVNDTEFYDSLEWVDYWWYELEFDLGGWPD